MMKGDRLAVAVGKLVVALINRRRAVLLARRFVTLAGDRAAHDFKPRRAACDFAAVFELVAFANGRVHIHVTNLASSRFLLERRQPSDAYFGDILIPKCTKKATLFFVNPQIDKFIPTQRRWAPFYKFINRWSERENPIN